MKWAKIFKAKLQELREIHGINQKQMAIQLGLKPPTFSAYENDINNPPIHVLIDIAKEFNVSLDWLCGIDETKTKIDTYSDVFKALYLIGLRTDMTISQCENSDYLKITFKDDTINNFLNEFMEIILGINSGFVNKDLSKLWIEDKVKNNNARIK